MIDRLLKAKHWQLFLLTFGVPILLQLVLMGTMFTRAVSNNFIEPSSAISLVTLLQLASLLFLLVFFAWFWAVATGLQQFIPTEAKMKLTRFKIFFFIPLIYVVLFLLFVSTATTETINHSGTISPVMIGAALTIILPLHFLSMFCIFHSLYFVAKALKTAELKRKARFSDFAGEFFLIWFFPIGIWIVQPRINKMIQGLDPTIYPIES